MATGGKADRRGSEYGAATPLGRAAGTVRAWIALAIVATFLIGHLAGAVLLLRAGQSEAGLGLLGVLAAEAGSVTGFYFGVRQANG